jgi:hypothetical protein
MPDVTLGNTSTELGTPQEELTALDELFREGGYEVRFEGGIVELSVQDYYPWIVTVAVGGGLANFLRAYTTKLGELAAEDTWRGLKYLVKRIAQARGERPGGRVQIEDWDARVTIHLGPDLPDEAYQRLFEIDWTQARGAVAWNPKAGDWTDLEGKTLPERTQS